MRQTNRAENPGWFNGAVPSFGGTDARLLVVGMAPGLRGANRTGRPFTGDYAGTLLYETLIKFGFAQGSYAADPADGLRLIDCRIANAVRCVPPANLPKPQEVAPQLRVILPLGGLAHGAVLRARGLKQSFAKFAHGAVHALPGDLCLADSYHVSRYNTSTRRLTAAMFELAVAEVRRVLRDPG